MYLGEIEHIDGWWYTHQHEYKERKILIKLRRNHNIKFHIFHPNSDKVAWTKKYTFMKPEAMLQKAKNLIDLKEKLLI